MIGLYRGSMQLAENDVHLNKGSNRFVFRAQVDEKAGSGSMEGLRVEVEAQGDTCAENNVFNAYSIVEAPPKIFGDFWRQCRYISIFFCFKSSRL